MKSLKLSAIAAVAAVALTACGSSEAAITVDDPWMRITGNNAAAYMTITNNTDGDQTLTDVSVDGAVATSATLHETVTGSNSSMDHSAMEGMDHSAMEGMDGLMTMQPVATIAIPAGQSAVLSTGGYHVMLEGVQGEHGVGSTIAVTLTFDDGSQQVVDTEVRE